MIHLKYVALIASITLLSCGKEKKSNIELTESTTSSTVKTGEDIFNDNNCSSCHAIDTQLVGPSLQDIAKKYKESNANLIHFFKGNAPAIVSTDASEIATMQPNVDGVTKNMTESDLKLLSDYMLNIK